MQFLTTSEFVALWRPLSAQETELAALLLEAANKRILEIAPNTPSDSPSARLVALEVVRGALTTAALVGHVSYAKGIGPWTKSGTLSNPDAALLFTDEHHRLLGASVGGSVHYSFGD
ncbi:hypothetical protein ACFWB0_02905 [Rhodococcus sp. NPDC060086]|uniref:hypothetical protein n=1 Tax=Rhodococcus sp. NPDC060086 TaxID=3347055 RepID=UPI003648CC69